jgi:adenine-specific DNA-methyltransferase
LTGLKTGFAYLRTHRLPSETLFSTIQHEQIWTALQLLHTETLSPFDDDSLVQQLNLDNNAVLYLPKLNEAALEELTGMLSELATASLYSWQPALLQQHFADERWDFLPIPQFLVDRFGGR